jgi:hypothetical protein
MSIKAATAALGTVVVLPAMVGCTQANTSFETVGIAVDVTHTDAAIKMHPSLVCDREGLGTLRPDYRSCRAADIDIAGIRSTLFLEVDKRGIVTRLSIHGEPYDGPFHKYLAAMTEKYGPPEHGGKGEAVWKRAQGVAILSSSANGTAKLSIVGLRWMNDHNELETHLKKGSTF